MLTGEVILTRIAAACGGDTSAYLDSFFLQPLPRLKSVVWLTALLMDRRR
jgi:hypothetical protein